MRGHRTAPFPVDWQKLVEMSVTRPELGEVCETSVGPFLGAAMLAGV